ncbi:unnamed protein product [Musa textilis]
MIAELADVHFTFIVQPNFTKIDKFIELQQSTGCDEHEEEAIGLFHSLLSVLHISQAFQVGYILTIQKIWLCRRKLEAPWLIKAVHVVVDCKNGGYCFSRRPLWCRL